MNLVVTCVTEANAVIDHDRIQLVRKAITQCVLASNTNGSWEITQLFHHLHDIIQRYPRKFDGCSVNKNLKIVILSPSQ